MVVKKKTKQPLIERVISWAAPERGLKRTQARLKRQVLEKHFRKFDGNANSRRTEGWNTSGADVNAENAVAFETMRDRARDLCRNNPWGEAAVGVIENHVIGSGILTDYQATSARREKDINTRWKNWSETGACDWAGQMTLAMIQGLVMATTVKSGECLVRLHFINGKMTTTPLKLEVLEGDFINRSRASEIRSSERIISGIEVSPTGERVAYHLYKQHPGSRDLFTSIGSSVETVRVEARFILHVYKIQRPGAVRGITWFHPVMIRLRELDQYTDAQLVKQKISAMMTGFITDPEGADAYSDEDIEIASDFEPGKLNILGPGQDITISSPPSVENFKEYTTAELMSISTGLGITYESLTNDFSNTNYSSGRMGWIKMWKNVLKWRSRMFVPMFQEPVIAAWMLAESLSGTNMSGVTHTLTAPAKEMIDPEKEVDAKIVEVRSGMKSLSEAIRESGKDPEKVFDQIQRDNAALDEKEIIVDSDPRNTSKRGDRPAEKEAAESTTDDNA